MKLAAPRITPPSLADLATGSPEDALDPEGIDGLLVEDARFEGVRRFDASYRETELRGTRIVGSEFNGCRFVDVRFDALDAPELLTPGSTLRDVEFLGSRLGVCGLYDAQVAGVRFDHCKIGLLGLQGATVTDLLLTGCTIDELDLTDATITRLALHDVTVGQLRLDRSRLSHVDLRGARLADVSPVLALKGATLTTEQVLDIAPLLADEAGILLG